MISCHHCNSALIPLDLFANCQRYISGMGLFEATCPFCEASIAFRPLHYSLEVGYLTGAGRAAFQATKIAPAEGLRVTAKGETATIDYAGRSWQVPSTA